MHGRRYQCLGEGSQQPERRTANATPAVHPLLNKAAGLAASAKRNSALPGAGAFAVVGSRETTAAPSVGEKSWMGTAHSPSDQQPGAAGVAMRGIKGLRPLTGQVENGGGIIAVLQACAAPGQARRGDGRRRTPAVCCHKRLGRGPGAPANAPGPLAARGANGAHLSAGARAALVALCAEGARSGARGA